MLGHVGDRFPSGLQVLANHDLEPSWNSASTALLYALQVGPPLHRSTIKPSSISSNQHKHSLIFLDDIQFTPVL